MQCLLLFIKLEVGELFGHLCKLLLKLFNVLVVDVIIVLEFEFLFIVLLIKHLQLLLQFNFGLLILLHKELIVMLYS